MSIEPFDAGMIERYLGLRELQFDRGSDGRDFIALIGSQQSKFRIWLRVSGPARNLLTIRISEAERYGAAQRNRLLELVNEWNRDTRWPKAYVRETSDPGRVAVVAENCYPLTEGIHFAAFTVFADATIAGAVRLFERISQSIELPSAHTLQLWLDWPDPAGTDE